MATTTIPSRTGFFWDNEADTQTATDLESAIEGASGAVAAAAASATAAAASATSASAYNDAALASAGLVATASTAAIATVNSTATTAVTTINNSVTAAEAALDAAALEAAASIDASSKVPLDGTVAMTGELTLSGNPTQALSAAPKQYVDTKMPLAGSTGSASFGSSSANYITLSGSATNPTVTAAGTGGSDLRLVTYGQRSVVLRSANGNLAQFADTAAGNAIANFLLFKAPATGTGLEISAANSADTNVGIQITPKGTGSVTLAGTSAIANRFATTASTVTYSGTQNGGSGISPLFVSVNWAGSSTGAPQFNQINIPADVADFSGATNSSAFGLGMTHNIASGAKGGRIGLYYALQIQAAQTGNISGVSWTAVQGGVNSNSNVGGTSGSEVGHIYGGNFRAGLQSGGTFFKEVVGTEIDVTANSGSSVVQTTGLSLVLDGSHAVQGTAGKDSALAVGSSGSNTAYWDYAVRIGDSTVASPMTTGATLFWVGRTMTVAHGIDLSNATFSSDAFKSTGFTVDGSGNTTAASVVLGTSGPSITTGSASPSATKPAGSIYIRTGSSVGSQLYVSAGGGTWNAVTGV